MIRRRRGFTLVEVLVAVAVVAIALGAGMRAAGTLIDNAQRLSDVLAAQWCAENQLVAMRLMRQYPSIGEASFGCVQLGREYTGRLVTGQTPNPNFRRVDVSISNPGGQVLVTISTVMGRY